ncbi:hypothetical protein Bcav_3631 [Beutenbergia cavernae DSM 12333]|uniref:STAS domain-containing protein n=1 Tax=Beutenbergia cavernae (strain ATCC BAA-8 / DSM 12333 / CCUG 43141 / JCM 11478 / NBRC 16432 / NCIMB 13614 / HKI 0122) TaxID=471853 RepID=C5C329_BEUC1|nr:hypothetical protein [Beutenbergia cavernae]ACQ81873.1 hypothetical protein Bcav_3631 [Beutenbergia cavernae DSM 12333]
MTTTMKRQMLVVTLPQHLVSPIAGRLAVATAMRRSPVRRPDTVVLTGRDDLLVNHLGLEALLEAAARVGATRVVAVNLPDEAWHELDRHADRAGLAVERRSVAEEALLRT